MENGGVITIDYTLLWQAVNMIVLFLLVRRYLYRPLSDFVKNRQKMIEDNINNAAEEKEQAEKLRKQYEESIRSAKQEAREIINNANKQSEEIIAEGKRNAKEEGEKMLAKAKEDLELEKEKVFKELKDEIAFVSVRIAERLIEQKIDAASQRELVERYLKEVKNVS